MNIHELVNLGETISAYDKTAGPERIDLRGAAGKAMRNKAGMRNNASLYAIMREKQGAIKLFLLKKSKFRGVWITPRLPARLKKT